MGGSATQAGSVPGEVDDAVELLACEAVFEENRAVAARCRSVHALYRHHERQVGARLADMGPGEPDWARLDPFDHACQALVAATGMTYSRAGDVVTLAVDVHEWAPAVLEAMQSGLMCERIATLLCSRMRDVDPASRDRIQAEVVADYLERLRSGERPSRRAISRRADGVIERIDPEGAAARRREAALGRSVRFRREDHGMCTMTARLTAAAGAILAERIDAFAGKAAPRDRRSLEQRRADALVAMATGEQIIVDPDGRNGDTSGAPWPAHGRAPDPVPTPVNVSPTLRPRVTVIATGVGGPVLEFARTGEAALETLTRMLASAKGATFELVDARPGTHDSPEDAVRYRIAPDLARRIRMRDGTCRHPGCAVPADACDIDHIIPFNHSDPRRGGLTIESNLMCLCRRHHRYKTFSDVGYEYFDGGRIRVRFGRHVLTTSPTGPLARARGLVSDPSTQAAEARRRKRSAPKPSAAGTVDHTRARDRAPDRHGDDDDHDPPPF